MDVSGESRARAGCDLLCEFPEDGWRVAFTALSFTLRSKGYKFSGQPKASTILGLGLEVCGSHHAKLGTGGRKGKRAARLVIKTKTARRLRGCGSSSTRWERRAAGPLDDLQMVRIPHACDAPLGLVAAMLAAFLQPINIIETTALVSDQLKRVPPPSARLLMSIQLTVWQMVTFA